MPNHSPDAECNFLRSTYPGIDSYIYVVFDFVAGKSLVFQSNVSPPDSAYGDKLVSWGKDYQNASTNIEHTVNPAFGVAIQMSLGPRKGVLDFEIFFDILALTSGAVIPAWAPTDDACEPTHGQRAV
eukprot:GHVS01088831.1.p1 GENE.GHVS01088831.1~~GHVS01088831.1.p1  ORF type:complete len:127 (-),score=10.59 GHVS01088831.1:559-939(-)